jgi:hypothetical protein
MCRIISSISVALLLKSRKTAAESSDTKYHLETATFHKLDIDSGRTKDSGARLTYELRNYVTSLAQIEGRLNPDLDPEARTKPPPIYIANVGGFSPGFRVQVGV